MKRKRKSYGDRIKADPMGYLESLLGPLASRGEASAFLANYHEVRGVANTLHHLGLITLDQQNAFSDRLVAIDDECMGKFRAAS